MQSQIINPGSPSDFIQANPESEQKPSSKKSPRHANMPKKRSLKASSNNENMEPNQPKIDSQGDQNSNDNPIEPKATSTTPIKSKQESNQMESIAPAKENNVTSKPAESPFTAFCKGLYLSPGPIQGTSPGFWKKSSTFFGGNEVSNFMSPIPINLNLGFDNGPSSPVFPRKPLNSNQFGMKMGKEESAMETEENTEKEEGGPFEQGTAYDEPLQNSPKFFFPSKKSIYSNTSLVPTQKRTSEIYSQNLTDSATKETPDKEDVSFSRQAKDQAEQAIDDHGSELHNILNEIVAKTPSPKRMEHSFNVPASSASTENLLTQRNISFGTAVNQNASSENNTAANSSTRSSVQKMKIDVEDDEGEDSNLTARLSTSNKKKVCCNCKKSRCLKLYCDCFARGQGCTKDCNCQNCLNTEDNAERKAAMMNTLERNPVAFKPKVNVTDSGEKIEVKESPKVRHIKGCNCKKSGCLKKYCECFQAGAKCTEVCKCENCKNMDTDSVVKKAQFFGTYSTGHDSHAKSHLRLESPLSEVREQAQKSTRSYQKFENEGGEDKGSIFEESDGDEETKKFFHPRKQLFTNSKNAIHVTHESPLGSKAKAGEAMGELAVNKHEEEKQKSHGKNKDRKRKGSTVSTAPPKTPTNFSDQKKTFDYTPSPDKPNLSSGRARRNIKPFGHLNPDEYELGK